MEGEEKEDEDDETNEDSITPTPYIVRVGTLTNGDHAPNDVALIKVKKRRRGLLSDAQMERYKRRETFVYRYRNNLMKTDWLWTRILTHSNIKETLRFNKRRKLFHLHRDQAGMDRGFEYFHYRLQESFVGIKRLRCALLKTLESVCETEKPLTITLFKCTTEDEKGVITYDFKVVPR